MQRLIRMMPVFMARRLTAGGPESKRKEKRRPHRAANRFGGDT
jgi:hypothetical protein